MSDGKKSLAERIVYDALAIVGERSGEDPVETLEAAIKQLTPVLEVRSRRVGGATYQVPVEVPARRARTLAVRWLVDFARNRREYSMSDRLAERDPRLDPAAGRRLEAEGRHLPHGPGQQGLRALPLVAGLAPHEPADPRRRRRRGDLACSASSEPPGREQPGSSWSTGWSTASRSPAGERLQRLSEHYDLVWATGWEDKANYYLPTSSACRSCPT